MCKIDRTRGGQTCESDENFLIGGYPDKMHSFVEPHISYHFSSHWDNLEEQRQIDHWITFTADDRLNHMMNDPATGGGFASGPCYAYELELHDNGYIGVNADTARDVVRWRNAKRDELIAAWHDHQPLLVDEG